MSWFPNTGTAKKVSKYGVFSGPHFPVFGQEKTLFGHFMQWGKRVTLEGLILELTERI